MRDDLDLASAGVPVAVGMSDARPRPRPPCVRPVSVVMRVWPMPGLRRPVAPAPRAMRPAIPGQQLCGQGGIRLRTAGRRAVLRDGPAVARRLGEAHAPGICVWNTWSPRCRRTSALTSAERVVRASNMVSTTPLMARSGLRCARTRSMVASSWPEPFERVVLALDRDEDAIRSGQGVHGEQAK